MKNLLILIVAAAVYLHFYPQPEVTKFYNEQIEAAQEFFSEHTSTKVRLKADKIYTDLEPKFNQFSKEEIERLKEITSSRTQVKVFYFDICQTTKHEPSFHPNNERLVCQTIGKYRQYF